MLIKKEIWITSAVAIICLILVGIFPRNNALQDFIVGFSFFLIVPWLYIKIVLGESMKEYGIQSGRMNTGIYLIVIFLFVFSLIMLVAYKYSNFSNEYRIPQSVSNNFGLFVIYEVFLVGFFLFLYEFFFHGWILNFFEKYFKKGAVFLQFAIFTILLALIDNLNWNFFPYMVINLLGGWIAYKSRAIWYSFIFGWIAIILLDIIFLKITKI
ncbi:MAG: Uncharacterized protein Athens071425_384 [Parcubacteria group bacterium Athens0714_25]|nr:MAG: Uncharacterized protein Athens071425_384 [Parcubacteria group bacterium Athens0714_25]